MLNTLDQDDSHMLTYSELKPNKSSQFLRAIRITVETNTVWKTIWRKWKTEKSRENWLLQTQTQLKRASEVAEKAVEEAEKASEAAERASKTADRISKVAGRALEAAGRTLVEWNGNQNEENGNQLYVVVP